jgi:cell division transport system permease protein
MSNFNGTYFFREGLKNIWSNSLMSIASIGVLAACLIIMGGFFLTALNINSFLDIVDNQNEIAAFLDTSLNQEQISEIGKKLDAMDNIASVRFVSKAQALDELQKQFSSNPEALAGIEDQNPLRHSFRVTLKDLKLYDQTLSQIKEIGGIANVRAHKDVADKLVRLRNILMIASGWLLLILAIISVLIISNTIKLAMFTRKREVNIMKYVGATDTFIRMPFVIEGIVIGIGSGLIAYLLDWYIYGRIVDIVVRGGIIGFQLVPFASFSGLLLLGCVVAGLVIGSLGSLISIRKYLFV